MVKNLAIALVAIAFWGLIIIGGSAKGKLPIPVRQGDFHCTCTCYRDCNACNVFVNTMCTPQKALLCALTCCLEADDPAEECGAS